MQIGHERSREVARKLADALAKSPGIRLGGSKEAITSALFRALQDAAKDDEALAEKVRAKIRTLKRGVIEGSREWDLLFERYFREEEDRGSAAAP